MRAGCCR
ncbi:hypothetical protein CIB84_016443 [Bambusicola thoracicus]|nr:hypothetical protein CIB84_016443 [Bambusicola thoracicus]